MINDRQRTQEETKSPDEDGTDDSLDALWSSYIPRQLEKTLKPLCILSRIAIRTYMENEEARTQAEDDGAEEE